MGDFMIDLFKQKRINILLCWCGSHKNKVTKRGIIANHHFEYTKCTRCSRVMKWVEVKSLILPNWELLKKMDLEKDKRKKKKRMLKINSKAYM